MDQMQTVQQPAPTGMESQPQPSPTPSVGTGAPQEPKKKSSWLMWTLIIAAVIVLGLVVWWLVF